MTHPRILGRYLAGQLVHGWLLVLAVIAVLFGLIELIDELDSVDENYTSGHVIAYVVLTLPQMLISLAPVIIFLGSLVALSRLEQLSELTIVRASGVSKPDVLRMLALPSVLLVAALALLMEFASAPMHQFGEEMRQRARGGGMLHLRSDLWSRDGPRYFRMAALTPEGHPARIEIFIFDADNQLETSIHAESARIESGRQWILHDAQVRRRTEGKLQLSQQERLVVDNLWTEAELPRVLLGHESMSPSLLYRHARYLETTGQAAAQPAVAFWSRVFLPLSCLGMVLLALSMGTASGGARSGMGRQLGLGTLIGVMFFLGSQILVALGQITGLSPLFTGLLPAALITAIASALFWRLRW